jgi:LPXTG-motif cell wall-anchored protein
VSARWLTAVGIVTATSLALPTALAAREQAEEQSLATSEEVTVSTAKRASGVSVSSTRIATGSATRRRARQASASAVVAVEMGDYYFRPRDVTVGAGDSVRWNNVGTVPEGHTATGDGFDSGVLEEGESYTHRFASAGTFDYICTLHPAMRGTVTVTAASSGGGGGGQGGGGGGGGGQQGDADGGGGGTAGDSGSSGAGGGSASGGSLPNTGLGLIVLAQIGIALLGSGLLVRRLHRA